MAQDFYYKEEVLLQFPKGRDEVKIQLGFKQVKGEEKIYLDVRKWYYDDADQLQPGKGFAAPMTAEEMLKIGEAIVKKANELLGK